MNFLKPIQIDKVIGEQIIKRLLKLGDLCVSLLSESSQFLSKNESNEYAGHLGKLRLIILQIVLNLLSNNDFHLENVEQFDLLQEEKKSIELIGKERAEHPLILGYYSTSKTFVFCGNEKFAEKTLRAMNELGDELLSCLQVVIGSDTTEDGKKNFRIAFGILFNALNSIKLTIFIEFSELIPDEYWKEKVESTKKELDSYI